MLVARPAPAVAQGSPAAAPAWPGLPLGTWRGWLQQPNQDSIRASFLVDADKKHIFITLSTRSGGSFDMSGVKLKDNVLTFDWALGAGSTMSCRMTRRDGKSFEGRCGDRRPGLDGKPLDLWLMMSPPGRDSTR